MKLSLIMSGIFMTSALIFCQDTNDNKQTTVGRPSISYEKRVEHGFGQLQEPRWAGDRPEWLRQEEADKRISRSEITINHRNVSDDTVGGQRFRGDRRNGPMVSRFGQGFQFQGFRGEGAFQRGCPLCEKHKKMLTKNHDTRRNQGDRGERRGGENRRNGSRHQ
jgi:hypothetical protein